MTPSRFSGLAVLIDVGGVLVMPDHAILHALADAHGGIRATESGICRAHYAGVAAADGPTGFDWGSYRASLLTTASIPAGRREAADHALAAAMRAPAKRVWTHLLPGAREGVAALAATGARLAIVSNSDGTVAEALAALALLPEGTPVLDSAAVGVAKPDPAIFAAALDVLGVPAERAVHVGDVPSADVAGAKAAGVRPLHLDPIGWCPATDHEHVGALGEVAGLLAA